MIRLSTSCGGGDTGRPLVASTLRGYRTWRPVHRWRRVPQGALPVSSVTRRHILWTPTLEACCTPSWVAAKYRQTLAADHRAPLAGCRCGIYAWYQPDDTSILDAGIFGAVEASGLILIGERGFRAQRARITAIVTRHGRLTEACAQAGIAVYRHRDGLLSDNPPHDVASLFAYSASEQLE
jgi:hypothetical protein